MINRMKKKIFLLIIISSICLSVSASANKFIIDSSKLSIINSKTNSLSNEFKKEYNLEYKIVSKDEKLKKEIEDLSKKITYLLLGNGDSEDETPEEYYKRRNDYLNYRYNPKIPKDPSSVTGLDQNSQEYLDDVVSGMSVPGIFNIIDERDVSYNEISQIRTSINDNFIIAAVTLPNIKINSTDKDNPMEYKRIKTNLIMYYYFKKLDGEYKLYYLFGETDDSISEYNNDLDEKETTKSLSISKKYDEQLSKIYDFSKVYALSNNTINNVTNSNSSNLLVINAYYNNNIVASAKGILLNDGVVTTTWNFLEKALINAQYITIRNINGDVYDLDGIVTINTDTDLAVLKLKSTIKSSIKLGNIDNINVEDPVISISSKTGVGITAQTGIITSKDGFIQTSISLIESDGGSPIFNTNGEVIGMNTTKLVNNSLSMAIDSKALEEIKNKLSKYQNIESIDFDTLKEKYYYQSYGKENAVNSIPKSKWNKVRKIGDLEKAIHLELKKASYDSNVISLRYYNSASKYITSMQMAGTFKDNLIKDGYQEVLNSETKCIYENKKYKIIIMEEFDYLIIVMVKL